MGHPMCLIEIKARHYDVWLNYTRAWKLLRRAPPSREQGKLARALITLPSHSFLFLFYPSDQPHHDYEPLDGYIPKRPLTPHKESRYINTSNHDPRRRHPVQAPLQGHQ